VNGRLLFILIHTRLCFVPLALFSGSFLELFLWGFPLFSLSLFLLTELQNNEFLFLGLGGTQLLK